MKTPSKPAALLIAIPLAALLAAPIMVGDVNPPPGPVTGTMKPLSQVEPRTPVETLPSDPSATRVISQPGSYYLTANLSVAGGSLSGIEIATSGVTLDLCPTSNWQAGLVPSIAAHPLARLHRLGVSVTLSTDDTTVSDLSLTDEYGRALDQIGLTPDELWAIDRHALDVAFADEPTLARLRSEFDAWAERVGLPPAGWSPPAESAR